MKLIYMFIEFLYSNNELQKEKLTFTTTSKIIKYLGIKLRNTYTQKTIRHREKTEENTDRKIHVLMNWKNTVKMIILAKAIHRFNAILIKIPMVDL